MIDPSTRSLLGVARSVLSDLDLELVLRRVLDAAREVTGATYAALGVLDDSRTRLERFLTAGVDEATRRAIGALPTGRGVLGELIEHPVPLRLDDVGAHPHSYGFPIGHPPMHTFLGVPILVAGEPFGNLYLTDKAGGSPFSDEDEQAVVLIAEFAGLAIDHARRFTVSEARREDLERTVDALDATMRIARALGGQTDLDTILELIAKRGRALVQARALVIEQRRGDSLVVATGAGRVPPEVIGQPIDLEGSVASAALRTATTQRLEDEPNRARFAHYGLGRLGFHAEAGLVVPLLFRGEAHGVLIAVDRLIDGPRFTADDQRLLEAFAASAAGALATAASVIAERRSERLAAAEEERSRWARELHDETLQGLAALRLGLSAALKAHQPQGPMAATIHQAIGQLDADIAALRSLITDLRPAALDQLGPEAALEALADRMRREGLDVDLAVDLAFEQGRSPDRHDAALETAMYRIVQEALTNARKHGGSRATVEVREHNGMIRVSVRDDGAGFDPGAPTTGFGLLGMRERAELLDGSLDVESAPGQGTAVRATLPSGRAGGAGDQFAVG